MERCVCGPSATGRTASMCVPSAWDTCFLATAGPLRKNLSPSFSRRDLDMSLISSKERTFCASTLGGRVRDLTAGEMAEQVIFTQADSGLEVSNIGRPRTAPPLRRPGSRA